MSQFNKHYIWIFIAAIILTLNTCTWADDSVHIAVIDSGATGYVDEAISFTSYAANQDPLNHGTQVAKLIRSENPSAKITMLQVCDKEEGDLLPSPQAVLKAIEWSIKNNVDIVNLSLVIKYDQAIERAIIDASTSHGILFVAAAGNKTIASRFAANKKGFIYRKTKLSKPAFPASTPHVISVGAINHYGEIAEYSDKTCDVYADGEILGQKGTSFSSARITAKVARILKKLPSTDEETVLSLL